MNIPTKKLESGFEMPELGLGTWLMGGKKTRDPENNDAADIQAIKNAIDLGITHIDTAENYAAGHNEVLVGEAIKGYDRSTIFLVTKVDPSNLHHDDVIRSCKASLERLGTNYLDLYLVHAPNPDVPLNETMEAMDELVEQGLVRHIGVSNFNIEKLEEAQSYAKNKIVVDQVHYNAKFIEPEFIGLLEYCQDNDILLEAYRPLQKGALLDEVPSIVKELCDKYQKTPVQIYLNWLLTQGNVVTIMKSTDKEHLKENLGAVGWRWILRMLRN